MTNHFNEITKLFDSLAGRHDLSRVFNDFLTMGICSYHQTNIRSQLREKDEANEALYMSTIKTYKKEELDKFPKILSHFQMSAYDQPYSDILGEFFMQNITKGQNGQYFTPEPLCDMMVRLNGEEGKGSVEHKTALDPACGSGRILLSFAKLNPNNHFFGADNSAICAKMTTLNFFISGLRGEVANMNSLSMEWYEGWEINMESIGILPIEKEHSRIWTAPPIKNKSTPEQGGQLTLF